MNEIGSRTENSLNPRDVNLLEPIPLVRLLLLVFIKKRPESSGYDLMNTIDEFSNGLVTLKSGTVYSELRRMEKEGLLKSTREQIGRKRRLYQITADGISELEELSSQVSLRVNKILRPLLDLLRTV